MQTAHNHNVSRLNHGTVYQHIRSFLRNKGAKSSNTQSAYENDIRQFYMYLRNKEIESLTNDDLMCINSDVLDYQTYLTKEYKQPNGEPYSNNTVNRKISSIQALYTFLKRNKYDVDPEHLKIDELPEDTKTIGFLSPEEVKKMIEKVKEHNNGQEKSVLLMLALRTGLRKSALINLKWNQIRPHPTKENYYLIMTFDKGTNVEKDIHEKMYAAMIEIKTNSERIFNMTERTANNMIHRLCDELGIDPSRNISFHSIKKASGQIVMDMTGDIYAVAEQLSHKNINTTAKHYMKPKRNIASKMDEEAEMDIYMDMSKEELLELALKFGHNEKMKQCAEDIVRQRKSSHN